MSESLPCIVCDSPLEDAMVDPSQGNQPYAGTEFTARGHYGSTVHDLDPALLVVNVCDPCLKLKKDMVRWRSLPVLRGVKDTPWRI